MTADPEARLREMIRAALSEADEAEHRAWERGVYDDEASAARLDVLVAALLSLLTGPTAPRCANCDHVEPHNGPAGDVADACTHPMCNCGFDSRGSSPEIPR